MSSGRDPRRKNAKCRIDRVKAAKPTPVRGLTPVPDLSSPDGGARFVPDGTGGGSLTFRGRDGQIHAIRKEAHRG